MIGVKIKQKKRTLALQIFPIQVIQFLYIVIDACIHTYIHLYIHLLETSPREDRKKKKGRGKGN